MEWFLSYPIGILLIKFFTEAQRGCSQQDDGKDDQGDGLGNDHLDPHPLDDDTAQDIYKIGKGEQVANKLQKDR
jgi:hypothetical protein